MKQSLEEKRLRRIAKRVNILTDNILHVEKTTDEEKLKDYYDCVAEITKEIEDIINDTEEREKKNIKIAQVYVDQYLLDTYDAANSLLPIESGLTHIGERIISNRTFNEKIRNIYRKISVKIFVTLVKLDKFYKRWLNSNFNFHGLTAIEINDMMNNLKLMKNNIDKICNKMK